MNHLEFLRDFAERRGFDLGAMLAEDFEPEPEFDPAAYRVQCATETLDRLIPAGFAAAVASEPAVLAWVGRMLDGDDRGLCFIGEIGVGKTYQAFGALRAVVTERARRGPRLPVWAAGTHAQIVAAARTNGTGIESYVEAELLLLDDLGADHVTDWGAATIGGIIDARTAAARPTIVTTNLDPEQIIAKLGERTLSRLMGPADSVDVVVMDGPDRRRS